MDPRLAIFGLVLLAYLLGSVSGSLWLGRRRGIDIRTQGSGNAGGTNAFRTQGARFALGVVAIDIGKGALATWLALSLAPQAGPWSPQSVGFAAALAAAAGHVWPLWHGFRGGKGAATLVGGLLLAWPAAVPWLGGAWAAVVVLTGYVGLATVLAGLCLPLLGWISQAASAHQAFAAACALLLLFTHRGNLARLAAGTEARFERARLLRRRVRN